LLVIKIKDDTIFNRVDAELKKNEQVIKSDKDGVKMRTMPIPLPLAVNVRPTIATGNGYLFIGSSDAIVQEALAVKSGAKPGLKGTAEFKQLAQGIPTTGNQFSYMSKLFGQTISQVQQQIMSAQSANGNAAQTEWLQTLFKNRVTQMYSVGQNTDTGLLTVGNGTQSMADLALLPVISVPAMLGAIAVPNFVKARSTAQQNACVNNLRMIDAAKRQWALEKNKKDDDTPVEDDLLPYLPNQKLPKCPQGGTYTIGSLSEPPTCSIPGHVLLQ
jgi:competence protein ComGC